MERRTSLAMAKQNSYVHALYDAWTTSCLQMSNLSGTLRGLSFSHTVASAINLLNCDRQSPQPCGGTGTSWRSDPRRLQGQKVNMTCGQVNFTVGWSS